MCLKEQFMCVRGSKAETEIVADIHTYYTNEASIIFFACFDQASSV